MNCATPTACVTCRAVSSYVFYCRYNVWQLVAIYGSVLSNVILTLWNRSQCND